VCQIAILEAFAGLEDRRRAGQRHTLALCLALFTLAITAGNQWLAIGDWITSYREQIELLKPQKIDCPLIALYVVLCYALIIPSILRVLLSFDVQPDAGETIGLDGKVLKGFISTWNEFRPHPAIMLVNAYIALVGLILEPFEVDAKTNEIKALPIWLKNWLFKELFSYLMPLPKNNLPVNFRQWQWLYCCSQREPTEFT